MSSSNGEALVDKLHGALAAFRRERDELHRKRDLAAERLSLEQEELTSLERSVGTLDQKLIQLNDSTAIERDLITLQATVERLNNDVSFQHDQLMTKRNKMESVQSKLNDETAERLGTIEALKSVERQHRARAQSTPRAEILEGTLLQELEFIELELMDETWWNQSLPKWIKNCSTNVLTNESNAVAKDSHLLQQLLELYKQQIESKTDAMDPVASTNAVETPPVAAMVE